MPTWATSAARRFASRGSRWSCRRSSSTISGKARCCSPIPPRSIRSSKWRRRWALWPLIVIATAAAIIASQALISGSFSLTRQAVQLGLAPRLDVQHTSAREMGQVYVPRVNWALMVATVAIVIGFGSSSAMAAAYGIAVTLTMIITVLLLFIVMTERWRWPMPLAVIVMGVFLTIDLAFFGANALKIMQGGWLPLAVATVLFTMMVTWRDGRQIVAQRLASRAVMIEDFFTTIDFMKPARVPGTAVYMTAQSSGVPPALVHNLQYNKVLHERVVILNIITVQQPHCDEAERFPWTCSARRLQRPPAIRVHGGSGRAARAAGGRPRAAA